MNSRLKDMPLVEFTPQSINYIFWRFQIGRSIWKNYGLLDKIKTKILFKIILPKSEFIITDDED